MPKTKAGSTAKPADESHALELTAAPADRDPGDEHVSAPPADNAPPAAELPPAPPEPPQPAPTPPPKLPETARILFMQPNASDCINGIRCTPHEGGMLSDPIPMADAEVLAGIPLCVLVIDE